MHAEDVMMSLADQHALVEVHHRELPVSARQSHSVVCRSKLAGIWYAYELQRRHPELIVPVLHPGVIATQMNLPKSQ